MIVYFSTKKQFTYDILSNEIGLIVHRAYKAATGKNVSQSEVKSWSNSLQYIDRILNDDKIPNDASVAIEYHLPLSSKRIDFILAGKGLDSQENIVLIELKQWESAKLTDSDAVVITRFMHGEAETIHPSYQAWSYKRLLEDFNQTVQEDNIQIFPCAYLHNYCDDGIITHKFYTKHIGNAPIFLKHDALKLRHFISEKIKYGDTEKIIQRIEHGKIRPSKNLADTLQSMLRGNEEFVLIDDQKVVFETAIRIAKKGDQRKQVLIVHGGPGTGKSVVAINLLVALTQHGYTTQYVTRNSAPRLVYEAKLTGSLKKSQISNLFSSSGSFYSLIENSIDCLVVDEAHRLNEKSGMFSHLGENQIKEIIKSAKTCIFFTDEDQKVTLKDIGDSEQIKKWSQSLRAEVVELRLESQFRCNGSDGYLSWLDNTLQIRETANNLLSQNDYDFKIIDNPSELHSIIKEKNKINNKSRMVAGYCWKWISKKNPILKDIIIGDYKATWNLSSDGQTWIIQPDSVNEIGCIHTCQGLEVDYIGVIVGPDLIVRGGRVITRPEKRASTDKSISGWKKAYQYKPAETMDTLDRIIKNTYRTLMTRGQKGCYVYFVDDEARQHFSASLRQ